MNRTRVTQQTSNTLSLPAELTHQAGSPRALGRLRFQGPLQSILEGRGWRVLRPTLDFLMLCAAVIVALGGVGAALHPAPVSAPLLALPALTLLLFYMRGLYQTRLRALVLDGVVPVLSGVSVAAMAVAVLGMFLNNQVPNQREWVRAWLLALLFVGMGRVILTLTKRRARAKRLVGRPVLIMGAGMVGAQVARRLESHPEYGLAPIGFLDEEPRSLADVGGRDVPVLGTIEDLDETVERTGVRNLIVAFSSVADARVSRLIQRCQELGVEVSVVPRMFDTINDRVGYDTVGGLPLLSFTAVDPKGLQFAIKYAVDRVVAGLMLLILAPLCALIALAVKLSIGGPLLFRQVRVGLDGHEFEMLKFRTMRGTPEEHGEGDADWAKRIAAGDDLAACGCADRDGDGDVIANGTALASDDRRTRIGRLLRSLSLDEIPQLWNVLRGDMSLIGPRPERASYVRLFEQVVQRYGDRNRVKSGITGWAQVHGLRGQTSLAERVEWDNYYIAHWSLGLDMKILALTLMALFHNAE